MEKLIAACGLVCSECEGYKATQANDAKAIEEIAAKWSVEYGGNISPESVMCDGCLTDSPRKCGHCAECDVRACAIERSLPNCAHCEDYGCEKISSYFKMAPHMKEMLDSIRVELA